MALALNPATENEPEIEVEDCSIWHYLIFCEEFISNHYENEVLCWVCMAPISGHPAFKCLECRFIQHRSCTELLDLTGMDIKRGTWKRHHLIFRKETENNVKKVVVCAGCKEVLSGPAYKCSLPDCTFHLHKECHQLSHAIQHNTHPQHPLVLTPGFLAWCGFRGKHGKKTTLHYRCHLCNFEVDNRFVSRWENIVDDCQQHSLIPGRKQILFTCESCGEETKDVGFQCSKCRILIHHRCALFPPIIKILAHDHLFSRTYCVRRVKKLENTVCNLCYKKVNTECGAYCCQVCDYIVHMKCGKLDQDMSPINSEAIEFDDYRTHLVYLIEGINMEEDEKAVAPPKIYHHSHLQHQLILIYEDSKDGKRCEACMLPIVFVPFYGCEGCNIFLHKRCAKLPETIRRPPFTRSPLTFSAQLHSTNELLLCHVCGQYRHGLCYKSEDSNNDQRQYDVQCLFLPETIKHECHKHLLHLPLLNEDGVEEICCGCGRNIKGIWWRLICSDCRFWLCMRCAILPIVAKYRYHPHLLKLSYTCEDDLEECYCLICEKKRNPKIWFYSCADCDFTTHIGCLIGNFQSIKLGSSVKRESHEHPLVFVERVEYFHNCHSCGKGISGNLALECTPCEFNFHIDCNSIWA